MSGGVGHLGPQSNCTRLNISNKKHTTLFAHCIKSIWSERFEVVYPIPLLLATFLLAFLWVTSEMFQDVGFWSCSDMTFVFVVIAHWFVPLVFDVSKVFINPCFECSFGFSYIHRFVFSAV